MHAADASGRTPVHAVDTTWRMHLAGSIMQLAGLADLAGLMQNVGPRQQAGPRLRRGLGVVWAGASMTHSSTGSTIVRLTAALAFSSVEMDNAAQVAWRSSLWRHATIGGHPPNVSSAHAKHWWAPAQVMYVTPGGVLTGTLTITCQTAHARTFGVHMRGLCVCVCVCVESLWVTG